jgi:hypothetical protein
MQMVTKSKSLRGNRVIVECVGIISPQGHITAGSVTGLSLCQYMVLYAQVPYEDVY